MQQAIDFLNAIRIGARLGFCGVNRAPVVAIRQQDPPTDSAPGRARGVVPMRLRLERLPNRKQRAARWSAPRVACRGAA